MRARHVAVGLAAILFAIILLLAVGPKASPSRSLAPAVFVSFDDEGGESRIFFHLSTETGEVYVDACDDTNFGRPWGRYLPPSPFEFDDAAGEVRFADMTWRISGGPGERVLQNVENGGAPLWGSYFEDVEDASAEPYHYDRRVG